MSGKLLWTGLTFIVAGPIVLSGVPAVSVVGAVLMVIGMVLMWLDK